MNNHNACAVFFLTLTLSSLCATSQTHAFEQMTAAQLSQACQQYLAKPQTANLSVCSAYLQGFIRANPQVRLTRANESDYSERAVRTRAPSGSLEIDTLKLARYCLSPDITTRTLAQQIADKANQSATTDAGALIELVLKAHYSC